MMRVVWEEWRGGNRFSSTRVAPLVVFAVLLTLLVTQFQPGSFFLVLVLAALVGGVLSGTQRWNQVLARDWVSVEGTSPLVYCLGKLTGFLLVLGAWSLCLLPPLVLVALVWSLPAEVAFEGLAWTLAAGVGAQAMGHLVTWGTGEFQRLLGGIFAFLWVAGSLQVPDASRYNPVWQVWRLFHDPGTPFDALAFGAIVGAAAALWALVVVILGRTEGRR